MAKELSSTLGGVDRPPRADARRNVETLLKAAKAVFATSGVDAPVREIADAAGVGVGTVYRRFPTRADLIAAVFRREIDLCADAAATLAAECAPFEALAGWLHRYVDFLVAKRGLASALHSGDAAYAPLHGYFDERMRPALQDLMDRAVAAGEARPGQKASDLISAVASLVAPERGDGGEHARRMVGLLLDGLRYRGM